MAKSFISYSWDSDAHKNWVAELATRLRKDGVDVTLDKWHLVPGDQLPAFMERAVRESDFVVIVCTPRYKARSDNRSGGVGYEGDIMSGEVLTGANQNTQALNDLTSMPNAHAHMRQVLVIGLVSAHTSRV